MISYVSSFQCNAYFESTAMLAMGWSSRPCSWLSKFRSQSSSFTSSEKLSSTAPARVPVTRSGLAGPDDQAKAAVRGISLNRTIVARLCQQREREREGGGGRR